MPNRLSHCVRPTCPRDLCGSLLVLTLLMPAGVWGQQRIVGRATHVGFPGAGAHVFRPGRWCPIVVTLRNEGTVPLAGRLVVRQPDRDGDVMVAETVVTLTADSQDRVYRLDFVAAPSSGGRSVVIQLLDEQDRAVPVYDGGVRHETLPAPMMSPAPEKSVLILDLSARPMTLLDRFADRSKPSLMEPVIPVRLPPKFLPDRGYALQSVRAILWDSPDADSLEAPQAEALIEYVRAGGILVLAGGRSAEAITKSPLARIVPVTVRGTKSAAVLQETYSRLIRSSGMPGSLLFNPPITVAGARAKPTATVLASQDDLQVDVVTRGRFGSGLVLFVAADLRDVFQQVGDGARFFKELFGLIESAETNKATGWMFSSTDMYHMLYRQIGFEWSGGAFLVVMVLFVAAYVLVSTMATWFWLRRRNALQHSWTVFGLAVVGCSAVSVALVQGVRGVGTDVRELSVVDMEVPPDGTPARIYQSVGFFGIKTGTHVRLDVRLRSALAEEGSAHLESYLQPAPPDPILTGQSYVAPEPYRLRPSAATIEDVPVRATLKRFQGYRAGRWDRGLAASIRMESGGRVAPESWIRNDLGVDLHNTYLIRPASPWMGGVHRGGVIMVLPLAQEIKGNGQVILLGSLRVDVPSRWEPLTEWQMRWDVSPSGWNPSSVRKAGDGQHISSDAFEDTLLLLTTMNEYEPRSDKWQNQRTVDRSQLQHMDRSHLMTNDAVILIGFADHPGPLRLEFRPAGGGDRAWQSPSPEQSRTMFRFIIPLDRGGEGRG